MLQIGEFAQLGRVSIKMLRHYDAIGLLEPAHIDHASGYRRYELGQLDRLHRIVALKDLGFTLAQIGRILDSDLSPEQVRGMLESLHVDVERRLADDRARLAAIEASLCVVAAPRMAATRQPMIRRAHPQIVASMRAAAADSEILFEELEVRVARYGARATRPPMLICHDSGDVDVAIPVTASIPEGNGIVVHEIPGAEVAISVMHLGGYEGLTSAGRVLFGGMAERGIRRSGPLHILYHRFGASCSGYQLDRANLAAHPGEYVTELLVPVEPRGMASIHADTGHNPIRAAQGCRVAPLDALPA